MEQELERIEKVYQLIFDFLMNYSFRLLGAVVLLLLGLWIAQRIANWLKSLCLKHSIDITLSTFLSNVARVLIIIMVVIMVLNQLGIAITPFIAAIGAASLGAGLAFQGLLSNYAAGLTIILTRLFKVEDTIRVQGVYGVVRDITLGHTLLQNEEGELITVPNRHIVGEIVHNSSQTRLLEGEVGIAYDSDIEHAIAALGSAIRSIEGVEAEAEIGIDRFDDSAIVLGYRVALPSLRFFPLKFQINRAILTELQAAGITIPFPQRVIHINAKE